MILPGWLVVCKQCESHRNIHTTATKSRKYSHGLLVVEKIGLNTSFSKGELGTMSITGHHQRSPIYTMLSLASMKSTT